MQSQKESDITLLRTAIEAITADNLKPSEQWVGLMRIPAYAAGVERFRELWQQYHGPRTQLDDCETCRGSLFNRLRRILHKLENS